MNKVSHPNSFELARVKHTVERVHHLDNENLGRANGNTCIIELAENSQRSIIPGDKIANTFYHELVHQMLYSTDFDELTKDEKFVTAIGNMLYEFDLTRDVVPVKIEEDRKVNIKVVTEKDHLSSYQLNAIKEVKQQASVKVEHELKALNSIISRIKNNLHVNYISDVIIDINNIDTWIEMMRRTFVEIPDTYEIKQSTGISIDNPRVLKEEAPMRKVDYSWPVTTDMAFMRDPTLKVSEDLDVSSESKGD